MRPCGLIQVARMRPEVEAWSGNKDSLVGLDVDKFKELAGRVDEGFTATFALKAAVEAKVSAQDLDVRLAAITAEVRGQGAGPGCGSLVVRAESAPGSHHRRGEGPGCGAGVRVARGQVESAPGRHHRRGEGPGCGAGVRVARGQG